MRGECVWIFDEDFVYHWKYYALFLLFTGRRIRMPAPNRNENAEFLSVPMAMRKLNLCRSNTVKLAAEAGALLRYGKAQRIDWNKLSEYFKRECRECKA